MVRNSNSRKSPYTPVDSQDVSQQLADKTLEELGLELDKNGKIIFPPSTLPSTPVNSRTSSNLPFRIPAIEKTTRQAKSTQGYKASAAWQTSFLLYDLLLIWTKTFPYSEKRRREQIESSARSVLANIEEGWARPSTKEYLDFLGFSQGSLTEIRGDLERSLGDELLRPGMYGNKREATGIPTPSLNFPYPPVNSRANPQMGINGKLREFTGKEIRHPDITYQLLIELVNKVDYLLKRTVEGLQNKIIHEEKKKLKDRLDVISQKRW